MKRIRSDRKSSLLSSLADRVGNVRSGCPSLNVVPATVIGEAVVKKVSIGSMNELRRIESNVTVIEVKSNCCNEGELDMLDLRRYANLKELIVGDECFENVKEVKLIGLHKLERVVIGKKSFTKWKDDSSKVINPDRHFYLKDCERVKELKIGCDSFSDYSVCEIENVPSLEVIEMSELKEGSSFFYASLELKSDDDEKR